MTQSSSSDKPFGITQIKAYIPISLDMGKLNYDKWRELFETHCVSFGVLGHLDGSTVSTPETAKTWKERDGLVKMWIYGTISESILDTVLKKNATARDLWLAIENLFRDNKEARALQLENELRTTVIADLSVHDYCTKMKTTSDLLANIGSPITARVLVMHILNGLSDKFDSIINVIKHRSPFPSFLEARSMLQLEEDRLSKHVKPSPSHTDTSSSSTILYTNSDGAPRYNNSGRGNRGRGRGGGRSRGKGRFNNYSQHQFSAPWNYHPQWPQQPYYSPPVPPPQYTGSSHFATSPFPPYSAHHAPTAHQGILGPSPQRPSHEAHMEPDNNWYMDSGASNHITSNTGPPNSASTPPV